MTIHQHPSATSLEPADEAFQLAYYALNRAKAEWDLALYAPEMINADLPEEDERRFCNAHCDAFDTFMMTPSPSWWCFIRKLRTFHDEGGQDLTDARKYIGAMLDDAVRLNKKN
jgi:hypothetical protein